MTGTGSSAGSLIDVPRVAVGHWTDLERRTGCTVVLCPEGATSGLDIRGTQLGTSETDLAGAGHLVKHINAVLLAGGTSFGLAAVRGVMQYLEERGHGFRIPRDLPVGDPETAPEYRRLSTVVPIVAATSIFDLDAAHSRPDAAAGYRACEAARADRLQEGRVGAGTGALAGKAFDAEAGSPGGVGTSGRRVGQYILGVLVVVNCFGCVVDPDTGQPLAGPRAADGRIVSTPGPLLNGARQIEPAGNNLAAVVATDYPLTREQANELAATAYGGFARVVIPTGPSLDSSAIFALSTATPESEIPVSPGARASMGTAAADLVAIATARAVRMAAHPAGRREGRTT